LRERIVVALVGALVAASGEGDRGGRVNLAGCGMILSCPDSSLLVSTLFQILAFSHRLPLSLSLLKACLSSRDQRHRGSHLLLFAYDAAKEIDFGDELSRAIRDTQRQLFMKDFLLPGGERKSALLLAFANGEM